jgi:pimeloyl-[acyl-carrier protein] methyl ester esterase
LNLVSTTKGQGPNLVLLHGWGLNSGVWQPIIGELAAQFTVTTIDLPGFGLNHDVLPEFYSLELVAASVAANLPDDTLLLGWSLGGLVAQQIALTVPHKIKHLFLLATSPHFLMEQDWPGIKKDVLNNFKSQLLNDLPVTISRFLAIQAMGSPSAKRDVKLIKQYVDTYPEANPIALSAGLEILATSDFRSQLIKLSMPCHLLLGRLDSLVPIKLKQYIALLNPLIIVSVFEHSSHAPFITEPHCFLDFIINNANKVEDKLSKKTEMVNN